MRTLVHRPVLALALAGLAACGGASSAPAVPSAAGVDPPARVEASDFSVHDIPSSWRDAEGRERTLASLGGRARVVAMVYTSCTHTCPVIVTEMMRLEAALTPAERARTGFVLVSLDPERDAPAQLARFAAALGMDPATWTLLTGDGESVRELAAVLGIRYRTEADGQISHSNTYFVLDGAGRVVHRQDGVGSGTGPALERLRAAAGE